MRLNEVNRRALAQDEYNESLENGTLEQDIQDASSPEGEDPSGPLADSYEEWEAGVADGDL
jgi:hypothetical protein